MKNTIKLLGSITLTALIGFLMVSCGDDGNSGNLTSLGAEAKLTGKVYLMNQNPFSGKITFPAYTGGNLTVSAYDYQKTGTIKGGQFSFPLEIPDNLENLNEWILEYYFREYDSLTTSTNDASGFVIDLFEIDDSSEYYGLQRIDATTNRGMTSASGTAEYVIYVYVDKNVTITGKGDTYTNEVDDEDDDIPYNYTRITKNFSLPLKAGWNTVLMKQSMTARATLTGTTLTVTETISLSNPSNLKWVLIKDDDDDDDDYGFSYGLNLNRSIMRNLLPLSR